MKEETKIYTEYCIRNQIAAGGSDDWQIRLGKYIVSLQYVDCPSDGFLGRLASLAGRVPQRLVAVVYQRNREVLIFWVANGAVYPPLSRSDRTSRGGE